MDILYFVVQRAICQHVTDEALNSVKYRGLDVVIVFQPPFLLI